MKIILFAIIAVLGMALAGWLTFASSEEDITIRVDKAEVRQDTKQAVQAGEKLIDKISDATEEAVEESGESIDQLTDESESLQPGKSETLLPKD